MAVKYKIIKTSQPGIKGGGEYKYIPRIYGRGKVDLSRLADMIAGECSVKRPDIYAVLVAMTDKIPKLLKENYSVCLDDLGTFSLHANVTPSDSENEVGEKNITQVKVAFRPGIRVKNELKSVSFTRRAQP
jgi:predicted histone-like DNA-binding protein